MRERFPRDVGATFDPVIINQIAADASADGDALRYYAPLYSARA